MVVLALGLTIFRSIYLDAIPSNVLPHDAAAALYDTILRIPAPRPAHRPRLGPDRRARAFLTGQSVTAVRTRRGLATGIGWLRGGAERAGWNTGPVGAWVYRNKVVLRIVAVSLAARPGVLGPADGQGRDRPGVLPSSSSWQSSSSLDGPANPYERCRHHQRERASGRSPVHAILGSLGRLEYHHESVERSTMPDCFAALARTAVVAGTATAVSNRVFAVRPSAGRVRNRSAYDQPPPSRRHLHRLPRRLDQT